MQTLFCHSAVGNALPSGKFGSDYCRLTKCAKSVRLSPIASGAASNSSTGRCRGGTKKVGEPNHLAPAASQPPKGWYRNYTRLRCERRQDEVPPIVGQNTTTEFPTK